jgi:cellulose synthase/poly-beta-1,6-N-acetylglucosamine synthase-like glycosyltransferase
MIIDDDSIDKTFETALGAIGTCSNYHIYKIRDKIFPAKKGALAFGISLASNPFILITDADCRPNKEWLKYFSTKFIDGYDFVFGITPFMQENTAVNRLSCFENLSNSILTFSAAKMGVPYSAAARSFGFRKSSFEKIKGYSNTVETLSGDDDLLLREAVRNKLNIGVVLNPEAFVYSSSKKTWKEYIRQRARHTKTSLYYLVRHKLFLSAWHLINLLMLFSPILIMINIYCLFPFIFKIAIGLIIILYFQKKFGYRFKLQEIIYLQILYELFLIINFTNAVIKKDSWV